MWMNERILLICLLLCGSLIVSGCSANQKKLSNYDVLLSNYRTSCQSEYEEIKKEFDDAEKSIDNAWESGGQRPKMPWDWIREKTLMSRYLSQEEFKITKHVPALDELPPSKFWGYAYSDYKSTMTYFTGGKTFTKENYLKAKKAIKDGRENIEKFHEAYQVFPQITTISGEVKKW